MRVTANFACIRICAGDNPELSGFNALTIVFLSGDELIDGHYFSLLSRDGFVQFVHFEDGGSPIFAFAIHGYEFPVEFYFFKGI